MGMYRNILPIRREQDLGIVTDQLLMNVDFSNPSCLLGSSVIDLVGLNTGTLIGGATYNSINGGVVDLDGVNGRIDWAGNSDLLFDSGLDKTISFWATSLSPNTQFRVVADMAGSNNRGHWVYLSGNEIMFGGSYNGSNTLKYVYTTSSPLTIGVISEITIVHKQSPLSLEFYCNGVLQTHNGVQVYSTYKDSPYTTHTGFSDNSGSYDSARLGSIKVYNKALTASEINQNFNATRGRFGV
jgi:hypothetical protein